MAKRLSPDNLNKIENRFLGVTFVGTKTINSQTYDIYYAKMMQLYTKINIINSLRLLGNLIVYLTFH